MHNERANPHPSPSAVDFAAFGPGLPQPGLENWDIVDDNGNEIGLWLVYENSNRTVIQMWIFHKDPYLPTYTASSSPRIGLRKYTYSSATVPNGVVDGANLQVRMSQANEIYDAWVADNPGVMGSNSSKRFYNLVEVLDW